MSGLIISILASANAIYPYFMNMLRIKINKLYFAIALFLEKTS